MSFIRTLFILIGVPFAWYVTSRIARRNNPTSKSIRNISALAGVAIGISAFLQFFTIIPAGHVGVMDLFGHVSKRTLPAGINLVNPFVYVTKFPTRTEENKQALSCEGFAIRLDTCQLTGLNPDSNARIYKTITGGDEKTRLFVPQFCLISHTVTASFQADAIYSTERDRLGMAIQNELAGTVATRGVFIEAIEKRVIFSNTRMIIVGAWKDGLPIILDTK